MATRAGEHGIPVIALAGSIGDRARVNFEAGIASFDSILEGPSALDDTIDDAPRLLSNCAERAMRMVMLGREMLAGHADASHQAKATAVLIARATRWHPAP